LKQKCRKNATDVPILNSHIVERDTSVYSSASLAEQWHMPTPQTNKMPQLFCLKRVWHTIFAHYFKTRPTRTEIDRFNSPSLLNSEDVNVHVFKCDEFALKHKRNS